MSEKHKDEEGFPAQLQEVLREMQDSPSAPPSLRVKLQQQLDAKEQSSLPLLRSLRFGLPVIATAAVAVIVVVRSPEPISSASGEEVLVEYFLSEFESERVTQSVLDDEFQMFEGAL